MRRYLFAYGPATPANFAKWLNAPLSWAAQAFESADLAQVYVHARDNSVSANDAAGREGWVLADHVVGREGWVMADDVASDADEASGVRLLPYFDAYVVGGQPRDLLFPGIASKRALAGGQAGNYPVVLVDGVVAGVWHQRRSGRRVDLTVELLGSDNARIRRLVEVEAERLAESLDATPTVTFDVVSVGAHA